MSDDTATPAAAPREPPTEETKATAENSPAAGPVAAVSPTGSPGADPNDSNSGPTIGVLHNPGIANFSVYQTGESSRSAQISVGNNKEGVTNIYQNFGGPGEALTGAPLKRRLVKVDKPQKCAPFEPADSVPKYARALHESRLLIVEKTSRGSDHAHSAMWSVLNWLEVTFGVQNRFTNAYDRLFSLSYLLDDDESWMEELRGSVIYLNRNLEPEIVAKIFDHATAEDLRARLGKADCRLLLMTDAATANKGASGVAQARAEIEVWKVGPAELAAVDEPLAKPAGVVETLIRMCCALFPGLNALEFSQVIDRLLPPRPTVPASAEAVSTTTAPGIPPPYTKRTTLDRWHEGERDVLLGAEELVYRTPPDAALDGDSTGAPGYYFERAESATLLLDSLFSRSQQLLIQHLPELTRVYFVANTSQRYQKGYLRYLLRLHSQHIHRLDEDWLVAQFREYAWAENAGAALWRFVYLLDFVKDHVGGEDLVGLVVGSIGRAARDLEDEWQRLLINHQYLEAVSHARAMAETEQANVEIEVIRALKLTSALDEVRAKLWVVYQSFILLASVVPTPVVGACVEALSGTATRRSFQDLAEANGTALPLFVPSVWLLKGVLELAGLHGPAFLMAFGSAVVAELKKADSETARTYEPLKWFFGDNSGRVAAARLVLIEACQFGFNSVLPVKLDDPLSDTAFRGLFAEGQARRNGDILGRLFILQGAMMRGSGGDERSRAIPTVAAAELISVYEQLCFALLIRKGANPTTVTTDMTAFVAPLRAALRTAQRLELINTVRRRCDGYQQERSRIERTGARKFIENINRRIRAAQIVTRAVTQGTPPTGATGHEQK